MTKIKLIILGAGKPISSDKTGPLITEPMSKKTVLDWQLSAASHLFNEIIYVAGYQSDIITKKYPKLSIIKNSDWKNTGPLGSLQCVPMDDDTNYVVQYGDVLYTQYPEELNAINANELLVYYDESKPCTNKSKEKVCLSKGKPVKFGYEIIGSKKTFELCGLVGAKGTELKKLLDFNIGSVENHALSLLPEVQRILGGELKCLPLKSKWLEINTQQEFAKQVLGTKAETLQRLRSILKYSNILEQATATYEDWLSKKDKITRNILQSFPNKKLIVRSSAISEDGFQSAFAGVFESILNVTPEPKPLTEAVDTVFESYLDENMHNQVLIQPMMENVKVSGVIFSRSIDFGAPYITINYDEKSGFTDTVTGGSKIELKTLKILKNYSEREMEEVWQTKILEAVKEIEQYLLLDELDIEFAVNAKDEIYIFQVRPLAALTGIKNTPDSLCFSEIAKAQLKYKRLCFGSKDLIFAKMPDWNPAEIIGSRPDQLSYSLYRSIIMDRVWAKQRFENGNADIRGEPLMQIFCGQPYVNLRNSIKSFIPACLTRELTDKITTIAMRIYRSNPAFHDKLEFEVIPTCFDYNVSKWMDLYVTDSKGLTVFEFEEWFSALKTTTKHQIANISAYCDKSKLFDKQITQLSSLKLPLEVKIRKVLCLLEEIGTLPFAHLARCGFIAVSILRSSSAKFHSHANDINNFQSSIKTISSRYTKDSKLLKSNQISKDEFIARYGHLRPATYNIYSKTYRNSFDNIVPRNAVGETNSLDSIGVADMTGVLREIATDLDISAVALEEFIKEAIFWREESKYIFTKGLSLILDLISVNNPHNLFKEKLIHHLKIEEILSLIEDEISLEAIMEIIKHRESLAQIHRKIELPEIIKTATCFEAFYIEAHEINFIGRSNVVAELVELYVGANPVNIEGKVVLIESADPGYDWIFGHNIVGLITEYGGSNSHMAIRAAEYNIPAAIGVGSKTKDEIKNHPFVSINCESRTLSGMQ